MTTLFNTTELCVLELRTEYFAAVTCLMAVPLPKDNFEFSCRLNIPVSSLSNFRESSRAKSSLEKLK